MLKNRLAFGVLALFALTAWAWAQQPLLQTTAVTPSNKILPDGGYRDPLKYHTIKIIHQVEIPAEEAGVLKSFDIREGQYIEKGELLGSIDKTDVELAMKIAASEYEAAKKTAENKISVIYAAKAFDVAKADYEASLEANRVAKGTVTDQQLRAQRLQMERSAMQAEMATEEIKVAKLTAIAKFNTYNRAKAAINRRDIIAPLNGVVVETFKHQGEWVQPSDPVLKVIQMDRLWIEGPVDGTKHAWHRILGKKVRITVTLTGGEERIFNSKVSFASPIIEDNEYIIRAEIENVKEGSGRWILSPGLDASVEILDEDAGFGDSFGGNDNLGF